MVKSKDKEIQDKLKNIVNQARKGLERVGKEAGVLAKKGEAEVVKISHITRLQFDIMSLKIKANKKISQIGEKTIALNGKGKIDDKSLQTLCQDYAKINKDILKRGDEIKKEKAKKQPKTKRKTRVAKARK